MYGSRLVRAGKGISIVISNKGIDDIIRIVKSLENSDIITDGFSETIKHETRKQEGGFLCILLGTLGVSMSENM